MSRRKTSPLAKAPELDSLLTRDEASVWLRTSKANLAKIAGDIRPTVPVFRIGSQSPLYHPRTIIAHLARKAGLPESLIAASFGIDMKGK